MANEIRLRSNSISGAVNDNPLTIGATAINSPNFADLPVVDATNHLILILDPLEITGPAEIVTVTAHTASATTVTVTRGTEGSTAREHQLGTTWFHGSVVSDFNRVIDPALSTNRPLSPAPGRMIFETDTDKYVARNAGNSAWIDAIPLGAWQSWTPTLTNLTLGSGTINAKFARVGRLVFMKFEFNLGAGSAVGSSPTISLPVTSVSSTAADFPLAAACHLRDSGVVVYQGLLVLASTTQAVFLAWNVAGTFASYSTITSTSPFTWASGDSFAVNAFYEAAS